MEIEFDRSSIKKIRNELGLNMTEFAVSLGTSRQRVDNIESMTSKPHIDLLVDISNKHDVPITDFFCQKNSKFGK